MPWAMSSRRVRDRRSSRSFANAMLPSTNPVSVMRSQKRRRSPRKVSAKSPNAAASPTAVTGSRLTRSSGRRALQVERRLDAHAVAQRVEDDAVLLRAAQQSRGSFAALVLGDDDRGVTADVAQP